MLVREATAKDVPAVSGLYGQLHRWEASLQPDYFKDAPGSQSFVKNALADEDTALLVVEDGEGVVRGFALVREERPSLYACVLPAKLAMLHDICVDEAYRGQGTGAALIEAAKAWAKARGLAHMELGVLANNPAQSLYQKAGFTTMVHNMHCKL